MEVWPFAALWIHRRQGVDLATDSYCHSILNRQDKRVRTWRCGSRIAMFEAILSKQGVHILHLVAHGAYHEEEGAALYLASCQTAARSPADAFGGLAPVDTALAMQDRVGMDTVRAFEDTLHKFAAESPT